ncbi:MAG: hypothetical protein FJY65_11240 [Calditrichaeota bacterium]|nr:hypothetical protein [Calditrichota bacterium]
MNAGFKNLARLAAMLLLLAAGMGTEGIQAREWSEEVQMTNADTMYLDLAGSFFGAVVDSNDVLHISYGVINANLEGQPPEQAVYQQFDKLGNPLMDPIFLGTVFPVEESLERGIHCYDLFLDRNQNIHILWGQDTLLHSMFNRNGEYIVSGRLEGLLMDAGLCDIGIPHGVVDSQGHLVVVAWSCTPWDPVEQRRYHFVAYGRWTFDGELIDTVQILADGLMGEAANDPQIFITEGDTLHFRWNQHPAMEAWFYAKVGPDDDRIIGPIELFEPTPDEYRLGLWNFLVDDEYRITHRVYRRFNRRHNLVDNLTQYLPNLDIRFDREITGEGYGGVWGHIRFGHNQEILMASIRIVEPDLGAAGCAIAYARFSIDGEYLDSLQFPQRRILTNQMWPALFSDSTVAVIWSDDRFADGIRGNELFMRYSLPPSSVKHHYPDLLPNNSSLITAHPNPFNGAVQIQFSQLKPAKYTIHIRNLKGEEVWSTNLNITTRGNYSIYWNGVDKDGLSLPNGSYVCILDGVSIRDSIVIQLIK